MTLLLILLINWENFCFRAAAAAAAAAAIETEKQETKNDDVVVSNFHTADVFIFSRFLENIGTTPLMKLL